MSILFFFIKPAVSLIEYVFPLNLYEDETISVVVFGLLLTIDLSNPTNLFNKVLFPTFVFPNNPKEKS